MADIIFSSHITERRDKHLPMNEAYYPQEDQILYRYKPKRVFSFFKRLFDIISSAVALILLSPLFLGIIIAIKIEDGGAAFFTQTRLTKDRKPFKIYKFRSMCVDAEARFEALKILNEIDGPAFKIKKDPRITKVGRFLRKTSLDELPQLVNILNGTMSVVGPRPPLPSEVELYTEEQLHRLDIKSGLTCYWQCSGRNNLPFDKWMELDYQYIIERNPIVDMKIIFKTIISVIKCDGAE